MASLALRRWKLWPVCISMLLSVASAQTITPANATTEDASNDTASIAMALYDDHGHEQEVYPLLALTSDAAHNIPSHGLSGDVIVASPSTQLSISSDSVALISCDPYTGNINGDDIVQAAEQQSAAAIVLYSQNAASCALQDNPSSYTMIYSMNATNTTKAMLDAVAKLDGPQAKIAPRDSLGNETLSSSGANQSSNGSGSSAQQNNPLGPSPSTAVAMIILYSITGIITALFLVIIITGAVRAHRHPERYGPRNVMGRARQSRARGLARAMLDTIPIVKVGNREGDERQKSTDVELAEHGQPEVLPDQSAAAQPTDADAPTASNSEQTEASKSAGQEEADTQGGIGAASVPVQQPDSSDDNDQGCPICTDDFQPGQDQRVLPCDHRFHPECIDPWLLNVSGTCPMCRIDLRPQSAESGEEDTREDGGLAPPLAEPDVSARRMGARRSLLGALSARHADRMTREERLQALRELRAQQQEAPSGSGEEEESSMRRRLRNAFRIRTRRTGERDAEPAAPADDVQSDHAGSSS